MEAFFFCCVSTPKITRKRNNNNKKRDKTLKRETKPFLAEVYHLNVTASKEKWRRREKKNASPAILFSKTIIITGLRKKQLGAIAQRTANWMRKNPPNLPPAIAKVL